MPAPYFSPQQLQEAVNQGQLTEMDAANVLSKQNSIAAMAGAQLALRHANRVQAAGREVEQYVQKHPELQDPTSSAFKEVAQAARELAADLGAPADDYRVHRLAMRQVLGQKNTQAVKPKKPAGPTDPLAKVPKEYREYWEKKGYTRERMLAEAQYATRPPRKVVR